MFDRGGGLRVWEEGRARYMAALAGGAAIALIGATQGVAGLAVASAAGIFVAAAATGILAHASVWFGSALLALAATYAVTVRESPDITLFEVIVIVPAVALVARSVGAIIAEARGERLFLLFVLASAGILALGALYSLWQPVPLGASTPIKELGKNIEIVLLALALFAYSDRTERFRHSYALVAMLFLVASIKPLFMTRGDVFSVDSLQTQAPLIFLILALPFASRAPVSVMVGLAAVILVVARTRGAWIGGLLIVLILLSWKRFRLLVGRPAVVVLALGAVAVVGAVLLIPSARARIDSLAVGRDQSVDTRLEMLHAAQFETQKHPLTGVGPGQFKKWLLVNDSPIQPRIGLGTIPRDPHNTFAKFAAEMGIPGLVLLILWAGSVLGAPWVAWRRFHQVPFVSAEDARTHRSRVITQVRPYLMGLVLYAPIYLLLLLFAEWGSVTRVQLAVSAGLFLSLLRVRPRQGHFGSWSKEKL